MQVVKTYDDGCALQIALGDNELYVDFEMLGNDGEMEIRGSVKWDGCMNWETSDQCMFHFCEPAHADKLAARFRDIWEEGLKLMPRADPCYGRKLAG